MTTTLAMRAPAASPEAAAPPLPERGCSAGRARRPGGPPPARAPATVRQPSARSLAPSASALSNGTYTARRSSDDDATPRSASTNSDTPVAVSLPRGIAAAAAKFPRIGGEDREAYPGLVLRAAALDRVQSQLQVRRPLAHAVPHGRDIVRQRPRVRGQRQCRQRRQRLRRRARRFQQCQQHRLPGAVDAVQRRQRTSVLSVEGGARPLGDRRRKAEPGAHHRHELRDAQVERRRRHPGRAKSLGSHRDHFGVGRERG